MSRDIFSVDGVDVAKLVADNLGPRLLPATLVVDVDAARDPDEPTRTLTSTPREHACRGMLEERADRELPGENRVLVGGLRVLLLGATLPAGVEPRPGNRIKIEGREFEIGGPDAIDRDPASATYTCRVTER